MKIEIQDFYPHQHVKKGNKCIGTMHIYLPDESIDIRGIAVKRIRRDKFHFSIPFKKGWDFEENKDVHYPCFSFTDLNKNKDLIKTLVIEGTKFMMKTLK